MTLMATSSCLLALTGGSRRRQHWRLDMPGLATWGPYSPHSKLTEADVIRIRQGGMTDTE
jgi:hypothetical protein